MIHTRAFLVLLAPVVLSAAPAGAEELLTVQNSFAQTVDTNVPITGALNFTYVLSNGTSPPRNPAAPAVFDGLVFSAETVGNPSASPKPTNPTLPSSPTC